MKRVPKKKTPMSHPYMVVHPPYGKPAFYADFRAAKAAVGKELDVFDGTFRDLNDEAGRAEVDRLRVALGRLDPWTRRAQQIEGTIETAGGAVKYRAEIRRREEF